jgi:hypothetical protein
MRFVAFEGKHMFNKRLTATGANNPESGQKKSRG